MYRKAFSGVFSLLGLLCIHAVAAQSIAPHLTPSGAAIETRIQLRNPSAESLSYAIQPYTADGAALVMVKGELAPQSRLSVAAEELVGSASHFTMEADERLVLSLRYAVGASKKAEDVPAIKRPASSWSLTCASELAVVNMGEHATPVWLHQRDEAGTIVASSCVSKSLAPGAKTLHLVDRQRFKAKAGYTLEVIGDQALGLIAFDSDGQGALKAQAADVKRTAESERDEVGIWFITDGSLSDVFEMMGYNVATDRMWQGELMRRTATGRLSEIFGADFVNQDTQVRITGYSQEEYAAAYAALSAEEQTVLSSYVDGFNRRIAELRADPSQMPYEMLALGFTNIEDWTINQVMAWAITLQHQFTGGFGAGYQISYLGELQSLVSRYGQVSGAAMFLDLHWTNDPHSLSMIPDGGSNAGKLVEAPVTPILKAGVPDVRELAERLEAQNQTNRELLKKIGAFVKGGSYAWVVSGNKTASGNPILYSGPQLEDPQAFQAPGIVQEGSIRGGGLNVAGLIVTGIPAVIVGRTPHHAWSFQVGHATDQDLYFESADNIVSQRIETIHVAGGEDVNIVIAASHRGQIINAEPLISHRSATRFYEFGFIKATLGLARATDMDSFGEAVANLAVSMHICYADTDKNIAYWHSGRQPVRPHGSWILPQGSIGAPLDWNPAVIEPLAHDRNNPQGFYGGWNNKATANYPDPSGSLRYSRLHIAHTINDYLSTHDNLTFDDVANIAPRIATTESTVMRGGNTWSYFGEFFKPIVLANPTPKRLAALDMIEGWNGQALTGTLEDWPTSLDYQDAWVLQDQWMNKVLTMTFADELPNNGDNLFYSRMATLLHLLDPSRGLRKSYNWLRNDAGGPSGLTNIVLTALDRSLEELGEQPWGLGQRSFTSFNHVLFGDMTQLVPGLATPYANRATYAQCVEYGENGPVRIGTHFVLGQSGEVRADQNGAPVLNPNNFGMAPYLATFRLRPFPLFD